MTLNRGQRIETIKEVAALLAKREWSEIDLVLRTYDLPTTEDWQSDEVSYCIRMVENAGDVVLEELHQYLLGDSAASGSEVQIWQQGRFKLFASHLAHHQQFVGLVGTTLRQDGVDVFVAHTSIDPSEEWQTVIESGLRTCDGMAVFLHEGMRESNWCDQEVGFALARRVPVLPINLGLNPYGFLGKFQAVRSVGLQPAQVGEQIIDWLWRTPSARSALTDGLVAAFENSYNFNRTRALLPRLEQVETFTPHQLERLDAATRHNNQISDAVLGEDLVPDRVRALIAARGGTSPPAASGPWSATEPPF